MNSLNKQTFEKGFFAALGGEAESTTDKSKAFAAGYATGRIAKAEKQSQPHSEPQPNPVMAYSEGLRVAVEEAAKHPNNKAFLSQLSRKIPALYFNQLSLNGELERVWKESPNYSPEQNYSSELKQACKAIGLNPHPGSRLVIPPRKEEANVANETTGKPSKVSKPPLFTDVPVSVHSPQGRPSCVQQVKDWFAKNPADKLSTQDLMQRLSRTSNGTVADACRKAGLKSSEGFWHV
jgi:hypothetical protein